MVGKDQAELYGGRVGLIHNTLADRLLDMADVVVAVGYVSGSAAAFMLFALHDVETPSRQDWRRLWRLWRAVMPWRAWMCSA